MKFIFTYDNINLKTSGRITATDEKAVKEIHVLTFEGQKRKHLYDAAVEIKKETTDGSPCIIFIDQYLECADEGFEWLQHNAGIALIKFLRMMGMKHHIVLISPFEPLELVKLNPANLIVASKGISLFKYLHEIKEKPIEYLKTLANNTFNEQNLKPFILAEFRLPEDERHNWANWWGIVQLTDVHRSLFPDELNGAGKQYFSDIDEKLKSLRSIQALCLFHHKVDFNKAIDETVLSGHRKQKNILRSEIEKLEKRISGTGKKNPKPDDWADYIKDRNEIISQNTSNSKFDKNLFIKQITETKNLLNQGKHTLEVRKQGLRETEAKINILISGTINVSSEFKNKISGFRFTGSNLNKPKIIYIDDNAGKGWSELFQVLVYGSQQGENIFKPIQDTDKEIDTLYDEIKIQINTIDPHLILLDLRLKNETGTYLNVEELSGAQILEKIREDFPGQPVMMTTASNKVWSYQTLLNLGADAYWMKEGIEVSASLTSDELAEYSVENYRKFVFLIHKLTGEEYQLMRKVSDGIENLKEKYDSGKSILPHHDAWWKDTTTITDWDKVTDTKRILTNDEYNSVFDVLSLGLQMYRNNFLKQYRLNSESNLDSLTEDEKISLANIINTLHQIVELIHRKEDEQLGMLDIGGKFYSNKIDTSESREDYLSFYLASFRHSSSHRNGILHIKHEYFKSYFAGLLAYLSLDVYTKFDQSSIGLTNKTDFGNNKNWGSNGINTNNNFITMMRSNYDYKTILDGLI